MKQTWYRMFSIFLCSLIVVVFLTGCWNKKELKEIAMVTGVGVDKVPNEDLYLFTFQIIIPRQVSTVQGGGGGDQAPVTIITQKEKTLFEAIRTTAEKIPSQLFFAHTRIFVFSEDVAKDGLKNFFDFLERDHDIRPLTTVFISKEIDAKTILNIMTPIEKIPSNSLLGQSKMTEKRLAYSIRIDIDELMKDIGTQGKEPVIGGVRMIGNPQGAQGDNIKQIEPKSLVKTDAIAIFRDGNLKGWLEGHSARGLLWVKGKVKSTVVNVKCENNKDSINVEILRIKGQLHPQINNERPEMNIAIRTDARIGETGCFMDFSDPNEIAKIEEKVVQNIKKEVESALLIAKEHQSDIFGFGAAIYRSHPEVWGKLERNWENHFSEIEVKVNVDVYIRQSGLRNKPLKTSSANQS